MSDKEWDQFFALVSKVSKMPGSWMEKHALITEKAEDRGGMTDLEEIAEWVHDSSPGDDDLDDDDDDDEDD